MGANSIDYADLDAGSDCNYWELDRTLQREFERVYPDDEFEWAESTLAEWGEVVGTTIAENAERIDRQGHELHTYDDRGEVQNEVEYHPLQLESDAETYDRGIVSDAFHAPPGREEPLGLQHTLAMQTILAYADSGFVCPVSMTSGAALVLDKHVGEDEPVLSGHLERLTARSAAANDEGAMFLTEKQGGSDVGANETRAEPTDEDGVYELYGEKWFCSNIDAEGTLALARRPDAPEGTAGLSLFLVPHTKRDGEINDQLYRRLKDKLGTIAVPTGEVEFHGAEAYLVGEPEAGFKYMAEMMNFERLTNATGSVGVMGRALLESKVHAADREAFGERIDQYPLMRRDLVDMQVDYEAAATFTFEATKWYDQYQRHQGHGPGAETATEDEQTAFKLMRLLLPIAKYKTGRMVVDTCSYACEVKGGDGYVHGNVTERLLRDAQVLPIWEGTSNILSLDVLRVLNKEAAHEALLPWVSDRLDAVSHPHLESLASTVDDEFADLQEAMLSLASADGEKAQLEAKKLADFIFDVVTASALLERAQDRIDEADDARLALVAEQFVRTRFDQPAARGITDDDRLPLDRFAEICRYESVDPTALAEPAPADD
jgi:acyl-CoA dehydrogenase